MHQVEVRSYKLEHSYDLADFISSYRRILQKAIDEIWDNIRWEERENRGRYRGWAVGGML